jgi:hypothetical protein
VPSKGFKVLTVKDQVYEEIKSLAEKTSRSISGTVEHLVTVHSQNCMAEMTPKEIKKWAKDVLKRS